MKKVFAEIGIGNDTFFSTEYEEGDSEYRVPRFIIPEKFTGIYVRFWLFKKVLIISTKNGIEVVKKDRNKFKLLFGVRGENRLE